MSNTINKDLLDNNKRLKMGLPEIEITPRGIHIDPQDFIDSRKGRELINKCYNNPPKITKDKR